MHFVRCRLWQLAIVLSIGAITAGCGEKGPARYRLSGKITYADKPVPAGILYFDPDIAGGVDGPQGHAVIEKGRYDTKEFGHCGGKVIVRVYATDGIPAFEAANGRPLFPEYTFSLTLPEEDSTKDIDIPKNAPLQAAKP